MKEEEKEDKFYIPKQQIELRFSGEYTFLIVKTFCAASSKSIFYLINKTE